MTARVPQNPIPDSAPTESPRGAWFFGAALLLFAAFCVVVMQRPLAWLLGVMPDDVFYYLVVARNLAQHGVSTFDGETVTNGYHPGWMLLMTGLAKIIPGRIALLNACLLSCFMLHALAALGLVRALRPMTGNFWAHIGGAFWLLNPLPLYVALQGMEGSLYVFALVVSIIVFNERIAPHLRDEIRFIPARGLTALGMGLGFVFWARTEGVLLTALSLLFVAICLFRRTQSRGVAMRQVVRAWFLIGGAFALCAAPWFAFSYFITGSLGQKSGAMKMLWASSDYGALAWWERLLVLTEFLRAWWFSVAPFVLFNHFYSVLALGAAVLLSIFVALSCISKMQTVSTEESQIRESQLEKSTVCDAALLWTQCAQWLLPMLLLSGSVYGLFFADHRAWYWGQPGLIFFMLFFGGAALFLRDMNALRSRRGQHIAGMGVLAYGAVLCSWFTGAVPIVYRLQPGAYQSVAWLESRVPATARIGAFNAGVPAYFSRLKIINLDGLMNNDVADKWRARKFDEYLKTGRIDYIADMEVSLDRARKFSSRTLPLKKLDYHAPSWRYLWRVESQNQVQSPRAN